METKTNPSIGLAPKPRCTSCGFEERDEYPGEIAETIEPCKKDDPWARKISGRWYRPTGERFCTTCWNKSVQERDDARKAALANRPKCQACGKHPVTYHAGACYPRADLCGWCMRKASNRLAPKDGLAAIMMVGGPQANAETIIAAARGEL